MENKTVTVNLENIFIRYFYALLKEGDTSGVSEEEFESLINTIKVHVEQYGKYTIDIKEERFEKIVNRVNYIHSKIQKVISIKNINGKLIAMPTYNLSELDRYCCYETGLWSRHNDLITRLAKNRANTNISCLGIDDLQYYPREIINISKKVAAVYVNDIIERYVRQRIEAEYWPSQCRDIDKYIFERDIAKYIDENGTASVFKQLYLHAIITICEILKTSKDKDLIKFSNSEIDMLAFANFKKIFQPEQFSFLRNFKYNSYQLKNKRITLTIIAENVSFASSYCSFSDPYGEWSDEYVYNKGIVDNSQVEIMEKRIGKI